MPNTFAAAGRTSAGESDAPTRGRWALVPVGVVLLLCLGTVYSWSIFVRPVAVRFDETVTDALLPFTVLLVVFAAAMPVAGRLIERWGPRRTALLGVLLTGAGYVASGFAPNVWVLVGTYGVITGLGVGVAYGVPLAVSAKHFPDRKGLAVGLTVVGFGLSPLITAPLARRLIASYGVMDALWILGVGLTAVMLAVVPFLKMPGAAPTRSQPGVRTPAASPRNEGPLAGPSTSAGVGAGVGGAPTADASALPSGSGALLRSGRFWALWVCFACGTLVGLGAIGISAPVATEVVKLDPTTAAWAVSLFAIFNGLGRPTFGWVTDRFSPPLAAAGAYGLMALACLGMLTVGEGDRELYLACFCALWMGFGGWLAIAPTSTLKLFDPARYASHYGLVYTAYGVGALGGTLLAGRIRDLTGSFDGAFIAYLVVLVPGVIAAAALARRRQATPPEPRAVL